MLLTASSCVVVCCSRLNLASSLSPSLVPFPIFSALHRARFWPRELVTEVMPAACHVADGFTDIRACCVGSDLLARHAVDRTSSTAVMSRLLHGSSRHGWTLVIPLKETRA